jgi:hypothetical protein
MRDENNNTTPAKMLAKLPLYFVLPAILAWLTGSLIEWNTDPGEWAKITRSIVVFVAIAWGVFTGISVAKDVER